jgi:hypothetical protein
MKQTAISEMIQEFNKELEVAIEIGNKDKIKMIKHLINIAIKYLPVEKQQIIDAHLDWIRLTENLPTRTANQYYNETFNNEENSSNTTN